MEHSERDHCCEFHSIHFSVFQWEGKYPHKKVTYFVPYHMPVSLLHWKGNVRVFTPWSQFTNKMVLAPGFLCLANQMSMKCPLILETAPQREHQPGSWNRMRNLAVPHPGGDYHTAIYKAMGSFLLCGIVSFLSLILTPCLTIVYMRKVNDNYILKHIWRNPIQEI